MGTVACTVKPVWTTSCPRLRFTFTTQFIFIIVRRSNFNMLLLLQMLSKVKIKLIALKLIRNVFGLKIRPYLGYAVWVQTSVLAIKVHSSKISELLSYVTSCLMWPFQLPPVQGHIRHVWLILLNYMEQSLITHLISMLESLCLLSIWNNLFVRMKLWYTAAWQNWKTQISPFLYCFRRSHTR